MLHRTDTKHSCLADSFARLVDIVTLGVRAAENQHRVVAQILEVEQDVIQCFLLAVLKEAELLLNELR